MRVPGGLFRAAGLALLLAGAPATAQDAARQSPIVTLDRERLFAGTRFGQAVQRGHDEATAALLVENRRIEAALEAEERTLTAQRAMMPPDQFRALAEAFDTKVGEVRLAQDAKSRAITRDLEGGRQQFFETAVPVLGQVMAEAGAVAIIDKAALVISFDRIDITDAAIERIDAVLGDGPGPDPAVVVKPDSARETDPEPDPVP